MDREPLESMKDESIEAVLNRYLQGEDIPKKVAMRQLLEDLLDEIMKGERR